MALHEKLAKSRKLQGIVVQSKSMDATSGKRDQNATCGTRQIGRA
jgi:hypothetical protein